MKYKFQKQVPTKYVTPNKFNWLALVGNEGINL